MIEKCKLIKFDEKGDERGHLVAIESEKGIPFTIKRVFYIYGTQKDVVRGLHANRKSEFILINVSGKSKVRVKDGKTENVFVLDKPYLGLYLPQMVWKEMLDFSQDSVLLVLSSTTYDKAEYIYDYGEYLNILEEEE